MLADEPQLGRLSGQQIRVLLRVRRVPVAAFGVGDPQAGRVSTVEGDDDSMDGDDALPQSMEPSAIGPVFFVSTKKFPGD